MTNTKVTYEKYRISMRKIIKYYKFNKILLNINFNDCKFRKQSQSGLLFTDISEMVKYYNYYMVYCELASKG